ncbi:DegV family EDD domain-containing protein [Gracilibacillus salitolerans]|uniref:DegV family EDD domain-containing protein n=1 Tax=Gracilibacillus salitolerans TaxID=2663022 RepID=A0A5Q2TNI2_9BACI|nr:DegV family protein [Gracilibacillus salitolerans]QGH35647.1 DegV family EDD domain-containing protein [Gracilibacillus salitolerans]
MTVKILADSACDLSSEDLHQFDIEVLPLTVQLDGEDYEDGVSISSKKVYDAMREGKAPKTAQVSPQVFKDTFEKHAKAGNQVLYLTLSSELSGTYQGAKLMEQEVKEEHPDFKLHVVDTKCASVGYGLVVLRAAELAQIGTGLDEILDVSKYHYEHMEHIFTVDDLEYLYRGGRVSKTAAFVGTLLKVKPLLHMEDGKLIPLEKVRGSKKVYKRMIEVMEERGKDLENQVVAISHGDALDTAEHIANMIREKWNVKDIKINMIGSSIGAHAGPGTIALFFLNDSPK